MTTTDWVILAIANIPIYWFFGYFVFHDWYTFLDSFTNSWLPNFDGPSTWDGDGDFWGGFRLVFWLGLCALTVWGESQLVVKYLLHG